jgi:hypothetical protein
MSSRVKLIFRSLSDQVGVCEEDFLTLSHEGFETSDDMYFRLPSNEKLEEFLIEVVLPIVSSLEDDGAISSAPRTSKSGDPVSAHTWLRGGGAASLRKLWEASKHAAKRDLETVGDSRGSETVPRRMMLPVASDLFSKARSKGLADFGPFRAPRLEMLD